MKQIEFKGFGRDQSAKFADIKVGTWFVNMENDTPVLYYKSKSACIQLSGYDEGTEYGEGICFSKLIDVDIKIIVTPKG